MDADGYPLLAFLILFLLGGGYFAATEIAFAAMNKVRVKTLAEDGNRRAQKANWIAEHFDSALTVILIGNNIMHVGSASLATLLATRIWGPSSVAATTLVMTAIVFLFCEMIPKTIAKKKPDRFAMAVAGSLRMIMKAISPVAKVFSAFAAWVTHFLPQEEEPSYTEDELQDIIETIEDEGILEKDKQNLVQSAFDFVDKTAADVVIPLSEVACLDVKATEKEVAGLLSACKYSRFPVYDTHRDHFIGLLQANRFYSERLQGNYHGIRSVLLPIRSFPQAMHINDLMTEMNQHRQHMAAITGSDGRIMGIVTMEDILEELVGDIYDEADAPAKA